MPLYTLKHHSLDDKYMQFCQFKNSKSFLTAWAVKILHWFVSVAAWRSISWVLCLQKTVLSQMTNWDTQMVIPGEGVVTLHHSVRMKLLLVSHSPIFCSLLIFGHFHSSFPLSFLFCVFPLQPTLLASACLISACLCWKAAWAQRQMQWQLYPLFTEKL